MIFNLNSFRKIIKEKQDVAFVLLLIVITILSTQFYNNKKKIINDNYKDAINNIYFQKTINGFHSETEKDTTFYMTHMLYNWEDNYPEYSTFYNDYKIILDRLEVKSLVRMKINLYPKTDKIETHKSHYQPTK